MNNDTPTSQEAQQKSCSLEQLWLLVRWLTELVCSHLSAGKQLFYHIVGVVLIGMSFYFVWHSLSFVYTAGTYLFAPFVWKPVLTGTINVLTGFTYLITGLRGLCSEAGEPLQPSELQTFCNSSQPFCFDQVNWNENCVGNWQSLLETAWDNTPGSDTGVHQWLVKDKKHLMLFKSIKNGQSGESDKLEDVVRKFLCNQTSETNADLMQTLERLQPIWEAYTEQLSQPQSIDVLAGAVNNGARHTVLDAAMKQELTNLINRSTTCQTNKGLCEVNNGQLNAELQEVKLQLKTCSGTQNNTFEQLQRSVLTHAKMGTEVCKRVDQKYQAYLPQDAKFDADMFKNWGTGLQLINEDNAKRAALSFKLNQAQRYVNVSQRLQIEIIPEQQTIATNQLNTTTKLLESLNTAMRCYQGSGHSEEDRQSAMMTSVKVVVPSVSKVDVEFENSAFQRLQLHGNDKLSAREYSFEVVDRVQKSNEANLAELQQRLNFHLVYQGAAISSLYVFEGLAWWKAASMKGTAAVFTVTPVNVAIGLTVLATVVGTGCLYRWYNSEWDTLTNTGAIAYNKAFSENEDFVRNSIAMLEFYREFFFHQFEADGSSSMQVSLPDTVKTMQGEVDKKNYWPPGTTRVLYMMFVPLSENQPTQQYEIAHRLCANLANLENLMAKLVDSEHVVPRENLNASYRKLVDACSLQHPVGMALEILQQNVNGIHPHTVSKARAAQMFYMMYIQRVDTATSKALVSGVLTETCLEKLRATFNELKATIDGYASEITRTKAVHDQVSTQVEQAKAEISPEITFGLGQQWTWG